MAARVVWQKGKGWAPAKRWCSEACRQTYLRDERFLRLKRALDGAGSRAELVLEVEELFGEAIARAVGRTVLRGQREG